MHPSSAVEAPSVDRRPAARGEGFLTDDATSARPVRLGVRAPLALTALLLAMVACGCSARDESTQTPTEAQVREAYFDTPLIPPEAAREVGLGITKRALTERLGTASVLEFTDDAGADCVVYPVGGTEARDSYGSPIAAEVWFCFGPEGRLVAKRRYPGNT